MPKMRAVATVRSDARLSDPNPAKDAGGVIEPGRRSLLTRCVIRITHSRVGGAASSCNLFAVLL